MLRTLLLTLGLVIFPATALGYPTSVVFTPTGEAKAMGDVGLLAYSATNLSPTVSPNSPWLGFEAGLLPEWRYGGSELSNAVEVLSADRPRQKQNRRVVIVERGARQYFDRNGQR